ncbi:MAG: 50S ribosomal protein L23 [Candidatus Zambryskibacteria bacterium CG10_big_fil_rev_8_21_14_0_10_34_34]|uniref:50S ribosomal protein L23 n=1 Tax=Candidatus Zambryskibacteria bacterium CG10_big_fil_rev_8_21_14_0_10_34_34 TaxID=1975114 RepID=A0A2H0R1D7_9BACT|nr:MAG: 50S ribosomal protein L23 [Candidatus Zambryskibacteria bacterium CG10_big_fil_rev_8_21_14_0_10_34_34]
MTTNLKAKYANILLRPRITEKGSYLAESNVYTFEVAPLATKKEVFEAIKIFYEVSPVKVNIVKNPTKNVFVKGKRGTKAGVKKAYVYLKKGDKIE